MEMEDRDGSSARKSILKPPADSGGKKSAADKKLIFDEENIKETHHPENKDYGFMKIPECNTPFERHRPSEVTPIDPEELGKRLTRLDEMTEEEAKLEEERRKAFNEKKKAHYKGEYKEAKNKEDKL